MLILLEKKGTQHAAKLHLASCVKSYTFRKGMSERFLNAINTDFKL